MTLIEKARHWKGFSEEVVSVDEIKEAVKEANKKIKELNTSFRKDNFPQRFSGDEFNDIWEERVLYIIKEVFGE